LHKSLRSSSHRVFGRGIAEEKCPSFRIHSGKVLAFVNWELVVRRKGNGELLQHWKVYDSKYGQTMMARKPIWRISTIFNDGILDLFTHKTNVAASRRPGWR